MAILPLGGLLKKTFKELKNYQAGNITPIKTGKELVDSVFGGLLPGDILTIAGSSGSGKSFDAQRLRNFIMDVKNNPDANNFVWLDNALEMKLLSTTIRDINFKTGKSHKKILTEEFTEDEKSLINDYYVNMSDGRYFIDEETKDPLTFEKDTSEFLSNHTDKTAVFISIDHIALMKSSNTSQKKDAVDGTIEAMIRISKKFSNVYWIPLSQLNRNIEGRSKEKDVNSMPNRSDLYNSDTIYQASDYVYVAHNPFKMGIKAFSRFNVTRYEGLEEHFCEEKGGKASFDTVGKIFYIVLKVREGGAFYRDVYIEDLGLSDAEKQKYRLENEKEIADITIPKFEVPSFDNSKEYESGGLNKFANWGVE